MTAPPSWRLPDPPKRRRSWLPEPDALPEPMEAASAPARRVSRPVRTTAPAEVRDARGVRERISSEWLICIRPFEVRDVDGAIVAVPVGERAKRGHRFVVAAPDCYRRDTAQLRRGEPTPHTLAAAKLNGRQIKMLLGEGVIR
jgi:hypothetical protein